MTIDLKPAKKSFDDLPDHLKKAYLAREKKSKGRSPREVGEDKVDKALEWIYRWGWASPATIDVLIDTKRRGFSARLVKRGLVRSTKTADGGATKGVPIFVLTLTELGVAEVERNPVKIMPYELNPSRVVSPTFLRHDQLTQIATARNMVRGNIKLFISPKEIGKKSLANVKQPDAIWILPNGKIQMIEVELWKKHGKPLDQFVNSCVCALSQQNDKGKVRFDLLTFITDSPSILQEYKAVLKEGHRYFIWKANEFGIWKAVESRKVPAEIGKKIQWSLIEDTKKEKEKADRLKLYEKKQAKRLSEQTELEKAFDSLLDGYADE